MRVLAVAMVAICASCTAADVPEPVDLYILSGQSNMLGVGELKPPLEESAGNCHFWNGQRFERLVPGQTRTSLLPTFFGPEMSFCRTLGRLQPERVVYLVKYAPFARGLHHGWDKRRWVGGPPAPGRANFYPGESPQDANVGIHYRALLEQLDASLRFLAREGVAYRIRGIAWVQGETDALERESAIRYGSGLSDLKHRLEADLGGEKLPLVFAQVLPEPPKLFVPFRDELRRQQARLHWNSGHPSAIASAWMVSSDGMPVGGMAVHYTAEGQVKLGEAMAVAMLKLQKRLDGDPAELLPNAGQP